MESLKKNEDFKNCYKNGRSYVNRILVMYVCGNGLNKNRIGISVSKKVGNSVVRHRITRRIREICRLQEIRFHTGSDIVFVARVRAREADYHQLENHLMKLVRKAGILSSYAENDEKNDD